MFMLPNVQRALDVLGPEWKFFIQRPDGVVEWWVILVTSRDEAESFCFLTVDTDGRAHLHQPIVGAKGAPL
jgi:hypothetical protein